MSKMFTATPPSVARKKTGGGRNPGDRELPYVAIKNNYSYGSPHSNMPKPPQLAETKVPLSVALKQQQDASVARMKEQQLERDRISGQRSTAEPDEHRRPNSNKASPDRTSQNEDTPQHKARSLRSRSAVSEDPPAGVSGSMPPPPRRSPRLQSGKPIIYDHSSTYSAFWHQHLSKRFSNKYPPSRSLIFPVR